MKRYNIVSARIEVSATDTSPLPAVPPHRLSHSMVADRVIRAVSDRADTIRICDEVIHSPQIEAPEIESAAAQALQRFQSKLQEAWDDSDGSVPDLLTADPIYLRFPNGHHETIGWVMLKDPAGQLSPLEYNIQEGAESFRTFVGVAVAVKESVLAPDPLRPDPHH